MKLRTVLFPLVIVLLASCKSFNTSSKKSQEIGAWGPIVLTSGKTSSNYLISPEDNPEIKIDIRIIQSDNKSYLYPMIPLEIGNFYQLFKVGYHQRAMENIGIREPCVAYLGKSEGKTEIWKKCPGLDPIQLTNSNGMVNEIAVSRSAEWVFFTKDTGTSGNEIWKVSPDGRDPEMVFACVGSKCSDLDYCSLTGKLVFIQNNDQKPIKIYDIETKKINEIEGSGTELKFSPDGQYLSYYDVLSEQLIIVNLSTHVRISKHSGSGLMGEWASDSRTILFGELEYWGGIPGVVVYELNVESGETELILRDPNQELEFYQPMYTNDKGVYLTSIRQRSAGPSKQFWLIREGAEAVKQIASDPLFHYSSSSWKSDYSELVFQQFPINQSDGQPQVVVWNKESDSFQIIANNASQPVWIP